MNWAKVKIWDNKFVREFSQEERNSFRPIEISFYGWIILVSFLTLLKKDRKVSLSLSLSWLVWWRKKNVSEFSFHSSLSSLTFVAFKYEWTPFLLHKLAEKNARLLIAIMFIKSSTLELLEDENWKFLIFPPDKSDDSCCNERSTESNWNEENSAERNPSYHAWSFILLWNCKLNSLSLFSFHCFIFPFIWNSREFYLNREYRALDQI